MKLLRPLLTLTAAVLLAAAVASAAEEPRPDVSTQANGAFYLSAGFWALAPGQPYDVSWTAHFADGDLYFYGGSPGRVPGSDGVLIVTVNVEDLVYLDPGEPLEWVRVCLRPPDSPVTTEIPGGDGHPLCWNAETGGYRNGYYGDEYEHAVAVSRLVATVTAASKEAAKAKAKAAKTR